MYREQRKMSGFGEDVCSETLEDSVSDCSTCDVTFVDDLRSECSSDHAVSTLIIFDWDDTLFPTSWLSKNGLLEHLATWNEADKKLLKKWSDAVEHVLAIALRLGNAVIVTNAAEGWVEMCCAGLPSSLKRKFEDVGVISARCAYEQESEDPSEWKRLAFQQLVHRFHGSSDKHLNLVSLGDSLYEQKALTFTCANIPNSSGKSVKFEESPTIEQLIGQLEFLSTCIEDVAEYNGDLDIEIASDDLA